MKLHEEFGASFNFKYRKLIPETIEECAIIKELADKYPDKFELVSEKTFSSIRCQKYEIFLKIKEKE